MQGSWGLTVDSCFAAPHKVKEIVGEPTTNSANVTIIEASMPRNVNRYRIRYCSPYSGCKRETLIRDNRCNVRQYCVDPAAYLNSEIR